MFGLTSIWTNIAAIVIGCVFLLGIGLLFVRASNIERRSLVATVTLMFNVVAMYLLVVNTSLYPGREVAAAFGAIGISILGFAVGRILDLSLGERPSSLRRDRPYDGDLAD
jgi:hypothetical protein